jgi:hypothetical protein
MAYRSSSSKAARTAKAASSAIAVLGLLALAGCSSSSSPTPPAQSELANDELHIYLDQCKQLEAGLYKCPSFDKSICEPEYNGQAQCVRTGRKGSIFVQSNSTN